MAIIMGGMTGKLVALIVLVIIFAIILYIALSQGSAFKFLASAFFPGAPK